MTVLIDNRTDYEITPETEKLFNDVIEESSRRMSAGAASS